MNIYLRILFFTKNPYKLEERVMITTVFGVARIPCTVLSTNLNLDHFCIILLARCEYVNKRYGINQTYITLGCKERCVCNFINGTASPNCSPLCKTPVNPVCQKNTQQVEVYQQPLKGSNCSCPVKRCITGVNLFRNKYFQIIIHQESLMKRFVIYDLTIAFNLSL